MYISVQTGEPLSSFYTFVNSTLNFETCTLLLLYIHRHIIYFGPIVNMKCVNTKYTSTSICQQSNEEITCIFSFCFHFSVQQFWVVETVLVAI